MSSIAVKPTSSHAGLRAGSSEYINKNESKSHMSASANASFLKSSPAQIWKSRISWRITLAAFLTILAVQAGIMNFTVKNYETERLSYLVENGRSAIAPLLDSVIHDTLASPITPEEAERLLSSTKVTGVAIYSSQMDLISTFGETIAFVRPNSENLDQTYRSPDGSSYEVILRSGDLGRPYIIAARLNSSHVETQVMDFVEQTVLIMLLMSAFVTSVLMLALGHWLLEPILFIRDNLLAATKNPEDPEIAESPYDEDDEIGGAIALAQRLIKQNSENIKNLRASAEDKIHKLAYYDPLTGLPNRVFFLQKLVENMRVVDGRNPGRHAVVTIDIDHFKDINDSMGHNVGDAILRAIGKRLRAAMPEKAIVSRSGEDEFAVCIPLSASLNNSKNIAEKVLNVIRTEPIKVFNEEFVVRASVGVSTFPDDGVDPDQILRNADIALNRVKEEGRDGVQEYSEDFDKAVQQRFQILRDLRTALEEDQLALFYQPQLDLKTGAVIGAEALIRWFKPDPSGEGTIFVSPGEFIPIAEQSGLIVPIGEWVLRKACETATSWHKEHGLEDLRVTVNVSAAQFSQSDICGFTAKMINLTGIDPKKLELEVTESVFMDDISHTIKVLQDLHSLGIELAIDDFGTGYSSLSYLRQFPIDRLKIDQSFIRSALDNPDDAAITKTIIGLGRSLNLSVIAEGVETKDHEKFLIEQGCDEVQGFRYSKPVPADDFLDFVKSYNGKLSSFGK